MEKNTQQNKKHNEENMAWKLHDIIHDNNRNIPNNYKRRKKTMGNNRKIHRIKKT